VTRFNDPDPWAELTRGRPLPRGTKFHPWVQCYIHRHFCLQLLTEVISALRDFAMGCNEVFRYYSAAKEVWKAAFMGISDGMKSKIYLP